MASLSVIIFWILFSGIAMAQSGMSAASVASINNLKNAAYCADVSVSANTITCSTIIGFVGYAAGQSVDVLLANSITAAATINVNALGSQAVTYNASTVMVSSIMVAGGTYRLTYDGTRFVLQGAVTTPASSGAVGGASNLTTVGAVPYVSATGVLNQDPTVFCWDATNNRLGIGNCAPTVPLDVTGDGLVSGTLKSVALSGTGTGPSIGTCGTIGTGSKNNAGFVTSTVNGTCTIVFTFSVTATTGWSCSASNQTVGLIGDLMHQTASSTTSATMVGVTGSGDTIRYVCLAY